MASKEKMGFWAYHRKLSKQENRLLWCGKWIGLGAGLLIGLSLSRLFGDILFAIVLLSVAAVSGVISAVMWHCITLVTAGENSSEIHDKKDAGYEQGEENGQFE
ncbi:MAG: hypothetical protein KAV00_10730 [Phycisphaerae bacterium]|nr:hypothetical protein [Phycisphaerae bacterium]